MEHLREVNAALLIERKREAEAALKLVRGQAEKSMEQEEAKDGTNSVVFCVNEVTRKPLLSPGPTVELHEIREQFFKTRLCRLAVHRSDCPAGMVRSAADSDTRAEQHRAARHRCDHPAPGHGQGLAAPPPIPLKGVCMTCGNLAPGLVSTRVVWWPRLGWSGSMTAAWARTSSSAYSTNTRASCTRSPLPTRTRSRAPEEVCGLC